MLVSLSLPLLAGSRVARPASIQCILFSQITWEKLSHSQSLTKQESFSPLVLRGMTVAGVLANGSPRFLEHLLTAVLSEKMKKLGLNWRELNALAPVLSPLFCRMYLLSTPCSGFDLMFAVVATVALSPVWRQMEGCFLCGCEWELSTFLLAEAKMLLDQHRNWILYAFIAKFKVPVKLTCLWVSRQLNIIFLSSSALL